MIKKTLETWYDSVLKNHREIHNFYLISHKDCQLVAREVEDGYLIKPLDDDNWYHFHREVITKIEKLINCHAIKVEYVK